MKHSDDASRASRPEFDDILPALRDHIASHRPFLLSGGHHTPTPSPQPDMQYRTIDGSDNNAAHPEYNAVDSSFARVAPARFADGVLTPIDGPNPRMISNTVVGEGDADIANPEGLSGLLYAWGQFIDHDLDLSRSDGVTPINIPIPNGDPLFPDGSSIPMTRAVIDPATGTAAHPATATNAITGWLDASMVYGSDAATAASLRLDDGHMKTSAGGNPPIVNGMFAAGDVRAAENPSLTALQTLFVAEHNHQVDVLHKQHPNWTGEQLYQQAKAIVTAEIAHVTYDEFLPHLIGKDATASYSGYDPDVDPRITLEFAAAGFRFGHSIVSGTTEKIDNFGRLQGEEQQLKDVFFESPADFAADGGAAGILRHLGSDPSQAMDARIVDDLRNFLFDPPAAMDLAAINIQRGRDVGLSSFNDTREALGLAPYTDFAQLTDDPGTLAALKTAFNDDISKLDLWTGGLSEKHAPGALLGETFQTIVARQFEALRDGDQFWYQNQGFDRKTLSQIEETTLADIIKRNTDTDHFQDDAFVFYERHSGEKGGVGAEDPDAPQLVVGADGRDKLAGGSQGDYLYAASGKQFMTGNAGADQFVFGKGATNAVVTDFQDNVDKVVFEDAGRLDFHDLSIKNDHGNAVIVAGHDHIVLAGVNHHALHANDFVFVA